MVVEMSRISKANVCGYRGEEIPRYKELGLDPNKIYQLYRDPAEFKNGTLLVDGKEVRTGAWSADGKPLVTKHKAITAEVPEQKLWVGTVGACAFEPPYLVTRPLTVITAEAQALIEADEQRELSAGYRYRADMTPGVTPDGVPYDGVMRDLQFNHVAIVREGRAGPDVHVADESPVELCSMKNRKLIARLQKKVPAIAHLSTADLMALDAELGETPAVSVVKLTGDEEKAATDAALEAKRKEHGADAELTAEEKEAALEKARDKKAKDAKKAADAKARKAARDAKAADALKGNRVANDAAADEKEAAADAAEEAADSEEEAEDEEEDDDEARDRRRARDERRRARDRRAGARDARKAARDALADPTDPRRDFRAGDGRGEDAMTMDQVNAVVEKAVSRATTATAERVREEVTAKQRALAIACDEVTPLVGKVQVHAFDSAGEVYAFALEQIGAEVEDDFPEAGLRTLVKNELRHRETATPRKGGRQHALDSRTTGGFDADALFQRTN